MAKLLVEKHIIRDEMFCLDIKYKLDFYLLELKRIIIKMDRKILKSTKEQARIFPVLIASIASSPGAFVNGFGLGYPSPIEKEVKAIGLLDDSTFPIFSSCLFFSAIIGSVAVAFLTDRLGRKALIILLSIPNTIGWLLITFGFHWAVMLFGRVLMGLAIGGNSALIPVYISDMAPKEYKGLYGSIYQHAFISGVLCSHLLGAFISFRWLALVPVVVLLLQNLILSWQPYSPKWLAARGLEKDALNTLKYLRGPNYDYQSEYEEMQRVVNESSNWNFFQRIRSLFFELQNLRILIIVSLVLVGMELTGISIIASYSSNILKSSRLVTPNVASFIPTSVQSGSVILFTFLVDRIGRKPLLLFSGAGIALSYVILSVYSFGSSHLWTQCSELDITSGLTNSSGVNTLVSEEFCDYITLLPMAALIIIRFMFGLGWGPIPWILLGESFPAKIRTTAASVSICVVMFANGLIVLVFPFLKQLLGPLYVFLIFVLLNISICVFVFIFVPETTGLSMEEVEELFEDKIIFIKCRNPFPRKYVYYTEM